MPPRLQAHGGDHAERATLLVQQPVGPYLLTVTAAPERLQVGTVRFAVLVQPAPAQLPLDTAHVEIEATPLEAAGPWHIRRPALIAAGPTYDADLTFLHSGRYRIAVYVGHADGVRHRTTVVATVHAATFFKWLTIILLGQAAAVAVWLLREARIVWRL